MYKHQHNNLRYIMGLDKIIIPPNTFLTVKKRKIAKGIYRVQTPTQLPEESHEQMKLYEK